MKLASLNLLGKSAERYFANQSPAVAHKASKQAVASSNLVPRSISPGFRFSLGLPAWNSYAVAVWAMGLLDSTPEHLLSFRQVVAGKPARPGLG